MDGVTCPRRINEWGPQDRIEGLDRWDEREGLIVCSYCGSLQPSFVLDSIELGATVTPTDKAYKGYVRLPDGRDMKYYYQHFTEPDMHRFVDLYNKKQMRLDSPGYFYVLPFFMAPVERA